MTQTGQIKSRRILIVEDEILIAMNLEDMLIRLQHSVVATATRLPTAMAMAQTLDIDLAILDINLAGSPSFPVAEILRARNLPFIFSSGYGYPGLIESYRDEVVLAKPYSLRQLELAIESVVSAIV